MQRVLITLLMSWMLAGVAMAAEPTPVARRPVVPTAADLVSCPSAELDASFAFAPKASRKAQQLLDALSERPAERVREAALQKLNP